MLREIADAWNTINWSLFRSAMRPPVFRLSDATAVYGMWRRDERVIEIAREHAFARAWTHTLETLKHEAAHQFVDEVLGGDSAPHGPLFREVCEQRGIDGRATEPASVPPPDATSEPTPQQRVIARVQKLLALAESSNPHEAELAAATAQRIMLKHNIDAARDAASTGSPCGHTWLGAPSGRVQRHQLALSGLLAEHFFVEAIWIGVYRPQEGTRAQILEVCGRPENLAMAEYVHDFVLKTVERLWREHKRARGLTSDRDRRSFLAGAVNGLSAKLRAQREVAVGEGLVWAGDAAMRRYFRRRHPKVSSTSSRASGDRSAYADGKSVGQTIVLSRPVERGGGGGTPKALPAKR